MASASLLWLLLRPSVVKLLPSVWLAPYATCMWCGKPDHGGGGALSQVADAERTAPCRPGTNSDAEALRAGAPCCCFPLDLTG